MTPADLRPCDACGAAISAVVYRVDVQQYVIERDRQRLEPIGGPLDLHLCIRCGCGLHTHALPLAIDNRSAALERARGDAVATPSATPPRSPA